MSHAPFACKPASEPRPLAALALEKFEQQGSASQLFNTGVNLHAVRHPPVAQQVVDRAGRAGLGIPGSEDDHGHSRRQDRPGAHRAGFEGHHECRVGEVPITRCGGGGLQRENLRVGSRVLAQLALVASLADHSPGGIEHESCDRYIAVLESLGRGCDGLEHPLGIKGRGRKRWDLRYDCHRPPPLSFPLG